MVKAGYLLFDQHSSDIVIVIYFFFIVSDQLEASLNGTLMNLINLLF
jgi:hypothetical protein